MTDSALERCVGDVERFAREHWGREPLLHHGDASAIAGLLGIGDIDRLISETLLRIPGFRMVRDGKPLPPDTYTQTVRVGAQRLDRTARPDRVFAEFDDGATIVLQALHRQSGAVAAFCRELELELTHPVQANAYITPPTARGFDIHHDTHDVFVIQTHGRKAWRVYRPLVELAGPEQPWRSSLGDPGAPVLEAELRPGDVLFIPRGFPHDAEARREVSVHVTVGIQAMTWLDVWRTIMREAPDHLAFREPLPVGFADDPEQVAGELEVRLKELHAWLDAVGERDPMAGVARSFWGARRQLLPGQMDQLAALDRLTPGSRVRRRPGSVFRIERAGERIRLLLGRRELRLPSFCDEPLRFVHEARGWVTVADLPGLADEASRLVLVRRLIREGALEAELGDR